MKLLAGIALLSFLALPLSGCEVSAGNGRAERDLAARQALSQIEIQLAQVREIGRLEAREGDLTLSSVLDRIDALEQVEKRLVTLQQEFAGSEVLADRNARRVLERHQAQYQRMLRMRDRLAAKTS